MIETLVPATAGSSDAFDDDAPVELFPEEVAVMAHAVDGRRREFATVRGCARRALAQLGLPAAPVLPGRRNAPSWPDGVVGSMTHCTGYRAAVVARSSALASIGIDAESELPLPNGVLGLVALPTELARIRFSEGGPTHPDRLLFSAKESVYKAWYSMTGTELEFYDAELCFTLQRPASPGVPGCSGTFEACVLRPRGVPRAFTVLSGRWLVRDGLVVTAAMTTFGHPLRRAAWGPDGAVERV